MTNCQDRVCFLHDHLCQTLHLPHRKMHVGMNPAPCLPTKQGSQLYAQPPDRWTCSLFVGTSMWLAKPLSNKDYLSLSAHFLLWGCTCNLFSKIPIFSSSSSFCKCRNGIVLSAGFLRWVRLCMFQLDRAPAGHCRNQCHLRFSNACSARA